MDYERVVRPLGRDPYCAFHALPAFEADVRAEHAHLLLIGAGTERTGGLPVVFLDHHHGDGVVNHQVDEARSGESGAGGVVRRSRFRQRAGGSDVQFPSAERVPCTGTRTFPSQIFAHVILL